MTLEQLKHELCSECLDRPMNKCECGCMRKAIINTFVQMQFDLAQACAQRDAALETAIVNANNIDWLQANYDAAVEDLKDA